MKRYFLFFLVLAPVLVFSQLNPKTKWASVSQKEIDYKYVPFEPEAGAVILYESGQAQFADALVIEVYRRIKILNERGIENANQDLIYFAGREGIFSIYAQTINYDEDGKRSVSRVKEEDIYDIELNSFYKSKRFALPSVKPGSIIEIKYTYVRKDLTSFDAWVFQHDLPTLYSTFEMSRDSKYFRELDYLIILKGEKLLKSTRGNKNNRKWELQFLPGFKKTKNLFIILPMRQKKSYSD